MTLLVEPAPKLGQLMTMAVLIADAWIGGLKLTMRGALAVVIPVADVSVNVCVPQIANNRVCL